jgi:TATA-binding protein-associated factor Taf7|tara:strand:+ start:1664 stop:1963 length:300 start_codon:yes stop_codon:yes gene_type:complete
MVQEATYIHFLLMTYPTLMEENNMLQAKIIALKTIIESNKNIIDDNNILKSQVHKLRIKIEETEDKLLLLAAKYLDDLNSMIYNQELLIQWESGRGEMT